MILLNFTSQEIFANFFSHRFQPKFLPWGRLMSLRLAHVGDLGTSWRIETGDLDLKILSSRWCTSGTYQLVERIHGSIHTKLYPDFCGTNIIAFIISFQVKHSLCWSSGWISFQTWPKYVGSKWNAINRTGGEALNHWRHSVSFCSQHIIKYRSILYM